VLWFAVELVLCQVDKTIDEQEKALDKNHGTIIEEIKKLKALLTDKQDRIPQNNPNP